MSSRAESEWVLRGRGAAAAVGPGRHALRRFRRDRAALAYVVVFAVLMLAFLAAPLYASLVAGTTPSDNHLTEPVSVNGEPQFVVSTDGVPIGPTWQPDFFLGADQNGRDLMVRLLYGGRTSVLIGACAIALTVLIATPLGLAAGYFRGRTDSIVSRLLDLIWSFPALLLGVLLSTVLALSGAQIGPITIQAGAKVIPMTVIGIVYVPYLARPLRGQVLALRPQPFVEAARAGGMSSPRVMSSELLPHLWTTILVLTPLLFANAVVLESALSFLAAGVRPPEPSFGVLISAGLDNVVLAPHMLIAVSIALTLFVVSLSGIAEGIRRAFDTQAVDLVHGQ